MHELSVTRALIGQVLALCRERGLGRPGKIVAELGALTSYKKDPILFYYDLLKEEHPELRGCRLLVKEVNGKIKCKKCGKTSVADDPFMVFCRLCNSGSVEITGGRDFRITQIQEGGRNVQDVRMRKKRKKKG